MLSKSQSTPTLKFSPDKIGGRYHRQAELGQGGFGSVFAAYDEKLRRFVALKIVSAPTDEDNRDRLLSEARMVAKLRHANIVSLYDADTDGGKIWMAMELIQGEDLFRRLHEGAISLSTALKILRQTAEALKHAHDNDIIHCDVKPSNILVEEDGDSTHIWLTDFGIAKNLSSNSTSELPRGTPNYMAPEHIRNLPFDHRVDIFSLGCLAIELLTGSMAFPGETGPALEAVLDKEPLGLEKVAEITSIDFRNHLEKWLSKSPDHRTQSIDLVIKDLDLLERQLRAEALTNTIAPSYWLDTSRKSIQELTKHNSYGVALLEPFGFGARHIVKRVTNALKEPSRPNIVIRLIPHRQSIGEERLYGAMFRDLRRGLEEHFTKNLPEPWEHPLMKTEKSPSERGFEEVIEDLLSGPAKNEDQIIIMIIESLSRLQKDQLLNWAQLFHRLQRLSNDIRRLKLLAWGGKELYDLCTGYEQLDIQSPFRLLKQFEVQRLTWDEVADLTAEHVKNQESADLLFRLTEGHPALVYECIDNLPPPLLKANEELLRSWLLDSAHLRTLRAKTKANIQALEALKKIAGGSRERRHSDGEESLRWLGVIERDGRKWRWAAPILEDWVPLIAQSE